MSPFRDDEDEMTIRRPLPDATVEAVLTGRAVPVDAADIAVFTAALRAAGTRPVEPTPALAAMIADGVFPDIADRVTDARPTRRRRARVALAGTLAKLAGLGFVVKTAAVTTVAVASVGAAGAGGALPGPAQDRVARIIESVTPFEAPDSGDEKTEKTDEKTDQTEPEKDNFGQTVVRDDARDGGVDGQVVSDLAKENGNRPDHAGKPSTHPTPNGKGSGRPDDAGKPTDHPTPNGKGSGRPDDPGKPTENPAGR